MILHGKHLTHKTQWRGPPGRYSYSSNSSSFEGLRKEFEENIKGTFLTPISENFVCHDEKEHQAFLKEQKKVSQKLPVAFLQFWETYQTAPRKANQSRKKAFEAWKEALKIEKSDRLIEAAKRAVLDQTNKMQHEEWFEPLPDCYRWLRDEKFVVLLESHTPAKAKQIIPGVTCLWIIPSFTTLKRLVNTFGPWPLKPINPANQLPINSLETLNRKNGKCRGM